MAFESKAKHFIREIGFVSEHDKIDGISLFVRNRMIKTNDEIQCNMYSVYKRFRNSESGQ